MPSKTKYMGKVKIQGQSEGDGSVLFCASVPYAKLEYALSRRGRLSIINTYTSPEHRREGRMRRLVSFLVAQPWVRSVRTGGLLDDGKKYLVPTLCRECLRQGKILVIG